MRQKLSHNFYGALPIFQVVVRKRCLLRESFCFMGFQPGLHNYDHLCVHVTLICYVRYSEIIKDIPLYLFPAVPTVILLHFLTCSAGLHTSRLLMYLFIIFPSSSE